MSSLADRNNNPGNIRDGSFAQSLPGYVGSNKGFAVFDSVNSGFNALNTLLQNYWNKGLRSVDSIISRWAPPSENDTNSYVNQVSKWLNVSPNSTLSFGNLPTLAQSIAKFEGFSGVGNPTPVGDGSNKTDTGIIGTVTNALTPTWLQNLLSGHTAARWTSVVIGIILIGLAIAAFVLLRGDDLKATVVKATL